jgi:hypothetical protein
MPLGSICPFCEADLVNDRVIGIRPLKNGNPEIRWTSNHDCQKNKSDCTHTKGKRVGVIMRMEKILSKVPDHEKELFRSAVSAYLAAQKKKRISNQESDDKEGDGEGGNR